MVDRPGDDRKVVREAVKEMEKYLVWVTYYGKGFDVPMLRTRLLKHGLPDMEKQLHVDLYFTLRSALNTSRRSQGHLLSWLKLPEQKMSVSADDWNAIMVTPAKIKPTMRKRCESDVAGLEALYKRTRHLIKEVTR